MSLATAIYELRSFMLADLRAAGIGDDDIAKIHEETTHDERGVKTADLVVTLHNGEIRRYRAGFARADIH